MGNMIKYKILMSFYKKYVFSVIIKSLSQVARLEN